MRFIGFTGHKSPLILQKMLDQQFPWDTCQMPINILDAHYRSFQLEILPQLVQRGIGPIGITATKDPDEIVALDADCVRCMPQSDMNPMGRTGRRAAAGR